jgi:hypothetical protein
MKTFQQFLAPYLVGVTILGLSSCSSPSVDTPTQPSIPPQPPIATPDPQKQAVSPANTIPITIYQVDSQCSELVPRQITVPKEKALETVIAEVLNQQSSSDFPLSYRVNLDSEQQIVTIDFRVPTTAERTFNSLSSCEQLALFGSLRQTLTNNPNWQINQVIFTEQGEEIAL